ncbi:hypothetical protein ACQUY5_20155 [Bacillus cereus]|uniref:hypothetical protein n=1 Tax=Bacillus cereus TaxID=1396 RepID=UPI003D182A44
MNKVTELNKKIEGLVEGTVEFKLTEGKEIKTLLHSIVNSKTQKFVCNSEKRAIYNEGREPKFGGHEDSVYTLNVEEFEENFDEFIDLCSIPTTEGALVDIRLIESFVA